jgi:hypothetical protein
MSAERSHINLLLNQCHYEKAFDFCYNIRITPGYDRGIKKYASLCIAWMFYEGQLDKYLPQVGNKEYMRAESASRYMQGYVSNYSSDKTKALWNSVNRILWKNMLPVVCVWTPCVFYALPLGGWIPFSAQVQNNNKKDNKNFMSVNLPEEPSNTTHFEKDEDTSFVKFTLPSRSSRHH